MNAPLEPAHSPFGGSVAARVLRCPASVGLVEKVPPFLRKTSSYAERGSALHAAMALLIEETRTLEDLAGATFGSYTLTADDVENSLRPAYAYVAPLLDAPGAEFFLEARVSFPDVLNGFGTTDLIIRIGNTIHVVDFKFGSGVRVLALYPDGDEDVINAQVMFYAAGARHSLPAFFGGATEIRLTILQPQSIDPDSQMESSVVVTAEELDAFVTAYRAACTEALAPAPRLEAGVHCRFCPARPVCPKHTGPLLDLAMFTLPAPSPAPTDKAGYMQALAVGLELVDAVKDIGRALHDQAKRALENGDQVPGYALSAGRAERHWQNENAALGALIRLGFTRDDVIVETTMRSVKQMELRAKARGLRIPPELIASRRSGVSLVRSENVRSPVLSKAELAESFSKALETFLKENGAGELPPTQ
jgi:hypothetical protein